MTAVVPLAADASVLDVDRSVDAAIARLIDEFPDRQLIVRVVRESRRDLGGSPVGAMPELVERLARVRLQEAIG